MTQSATVCDMPSTGSTKTIRVSRSRLSAAGPILDRLGMDTRSAIEMFLAQVVSRKALPFAVSLSGLDYAAAEYGATEADVAAAGKRMRQRSRAARRAGTIREVTGIDSLR